MRVVYETPEQIGLVVGAGVTKVFVIPAMSRSRLTRLNVIQTAGTPGAFTVTLYNKAVTDAPVLPDDELYRIAEPIVGAGGTVVYFFEENDTFFYSHDPDPILSKKSRKLYARILNSTGAPATYSLIMSFEDFSD